MTYRKVQIFWDVRKLCCNLPKIQKKRPNLRVFHQKDANGIANSEDPDQTAPRGAVHYVNVSVLIKFSQDQCFYHNYHKFSIKSCFGCVLESPW